MANMRNYQEDNFYEETTFNDERLYPPGMTTRQPSVSEMSVTTSAMAAQSAGRPRTSLSLMTGPLSLAATSRPTSMFSMSQLRTENRHWQSTLSIATSTAAPAAAPKNRRRKGDDDEEDNLDAFITDGSDERQKGGKYGRYEIPVGRRTAKMWLMRILGYLGAITFFAGMWALFWASVDLNNPAFSHYILLEPALNFRPRATDEWSTFIHYNRRDMKKIYELLDSLNEAVERYEEEKLDDPNGDHHTWTKVCDFDNPADDENACWIDTRAFGTYCYKSQLYGFNDGKPCILIRINKLVNWVPVSYDSYSQLKAAGFPLNWKEEDFTPGYVPITCEGQTDVDKELLGPMKYFYPLRPYNGLASYYFPFNGQLHYAPPGVMVNFYNLTFGVPIRIVCKLWAKNVRHIRESPLGQMSGAVEFELMVDSGIVGYN